METQRPSGLLAVAQQYLDSIFSSMHISARDVISYVTYFSIGFILGVALKRYGKWVVTIMLAAVMIMMLLQYFELITIHQLKIRMLLGLQDVHSLDDVVTLAQAQAKLLWLELSLLFLAIIIGFKLG